MLKHGATCFRRSAASTIFANVLPASRVANATAKSGTETGFGMPRDIEQKAVRFLIEPPHDFITVRYQRPQK